MHLRRAVLLSALAFSLGLPLVATASSAEPEACTGENCMPKQGVEECTGDDCQLPTRPVEECKGENCSVTPDNPVEECSGDNCPPVEN
jgi:hypothetical protein